MSKFHAKDFFYCFSSKTVISLYLFVANYVRMLETMCHTTYFLTNRLVK